MYRVFFAVMLSMMCATSNAVGADVPSLVVTKALTHTKKPKLPKATVLKSKKTSVNLQPSAVIPKKTDIVVKSTSPVTPETDTADLTWVLDPLVANADGGKNEGSASMTGFIVVDKPGASCDPEMIIDLEGHIVKTVNSTVRLDIQVGKIQRSVVWKADEIKSGTFNITLKEKVESCVLGDYVPASAIAFVTKEGDGHVAMVSLEKIILRRAVPKIAVTQ